MNNYSGYGSNYSDDSFWNKTRELAGKAGRGLPGKALQLHFTATSSSTPGNVKLVIWGALGYLILPVDAIPDFLPIVGLTDDLAALTTVLGMSSAHVTPEIEAKAEENLKELLG